MRYPDARPSCGTAITPVVDAGIVSPLRILTRCDEDSRIRRPVERLAVQLGSDERRGLLVELLVEQLERASEWRPGRADATPGRRPYGDTDGLLGS